MNEKIVVSDKDTCDSYPFDEYGTDQVYLEIGDTLYINRGYTTKIYQFIQNTRIHTTIELRNINENGPLPKQQY